MRSYSFVYGGECYDHAQKGVGLLLLSSVSLFPVPLPRTFRNVLWWSMYFRYDSYSRPFQYDVEWRSTFHELPVLSIWLHMMWTIYYKLYGIKYKYRVVAILYLSLVFVSFLTIQFPSHLLSSLSSVLSSEPLTIESLTLCSTVSQTYSHRVTKSRQALDIIQDSLLSFMRANHSASLSQE